MRRALMVTLLVVLTAILAGTRFYPTVTRIEVLGNHHYSEEEILELADLEPGAPFFWINRQRLSDLLVDPWIRSVRVIKHWPDTVALTVYERSPAVVSGEQVYALDGTVLGNAKLSEAKSTEGLTRIEGWGGDRFDEALALVRLLAEYEPKVISYSPGGFDIRLADTRLFTPSLDALRAHWAGFISQRGQHIAVYPWGVSVQQ